jgi:hypothetical protein
LLIALYTPTHSSVHKRAAFQILHAQIEHGEESAQRDPSRAVLW